MRTHARWLLRLIGPAILAYFLLTTDVNKILLNLRGLRWAPLLVSLALYPLFVAVKAWRWNLLMRDLGMRPPALRDSMTLYMIGLFLGGATPGQSGDFIKAWYLRERGHPLASALFSVLLDRLFDFLVMAVLSVLGLIAFIHLFPERVRTPIAVAILGFVAAIGLLIPALMARGPRDRLMLGALGFAPRRARARLQAWRTQFGALDLRAGLVAGVLLATLGAATSTMVRLWLLFRALDLAIPVPALVASAALISNLQSLPISFSGLGVRDAVLIPVLASFGYGPDKALALSTLFLLVNLENVAIGFLVSLRHPLGRAVPAEAAAGEVIGGANP